MAKGKSLRDKLHIDPNTLVIQHSLRQIKPLRPHQLTSNGTNSPANNDPPLTKVWTISIPPTKSQVFLTFVKHYLKLGTDMPFDIGHLKRFRKRTNVGSTSSYLECIICSVDDVLSREGLLGQLRSGLAEAQNDQNRIVKPKKRKLSQNQNQNWNAEPEKGNEPETKNDKREEELVLSSVDDIKVTLVPTYAPYTKEESQLYTEKYWPVIWKGDPNLQMLQQQQFDFEEIEKNLKEIVELANLQAQNNQLPIITRIYDPVKKTVIATAHDERFKSPLNHSIVNCISQVATNEVKFRRLQQEKLRCNDTTTAPLKSGSPSAITEAPVAASTIEKNYLCLNYDVYTTHEPCSFCTMALVHSRIGRLFYLKSTPKTGAVSPRSARGYCIHQNKKLNWSFEAFQWCRKETSEADARGDDESGGKSSGVVLIDKLPSVHENLSV